MLSIQHLFAVLYVGKRLQHQLFLVGTYIPSPILHLSGLSSLFFKRVVKLLPRILLFYQKGASKPNYEAEQSMLYSQFRHKKDLLQRKSLSEISFAFSAISCFAASSCSIVLVVVIFLSASK